MLETMLANSEAFYQSLGLPYQVVAIVSGALNNAAAMKYDLEAWFPFQGEYKELVSCSNCTDYQSRRLEVRCGMKKQGDTKKNYCHMLNGTLCATERALCCIVENYQTPEGLKIPEVLRPYMQGRDFLPYIKVRSAADLSRPNGSGKDLVFSLDSSPPPFLSRNCQRARLRRRRSRAEQSERHVSIRLIHISMAQSAAESVELSVGTTPPFLVYYRTRQKSLN